MPADPWSRPTIGDMRQALESFGGSSSIHGASQENRRSSERRVLRVPAELTTGRGNVVSAMTREFSGGGIGLIHRGVVPLGEARLTLQGDTRPIRYLVHIEWCVPCRNGICLSGARLLEP